MPKNSQSLINQEIIGHSPKWLTRVGSSILLIVILLIFFFSYLIKYPETIITNVTLDLKSEPILIKSSHKGELIFLDNINNKQVKTDAIIGHIVGNQLEHKIIAPITGKVYFHRTFKQNKTVNVNDELAYIIPTTSEKDIYAFTHITKYDFTKVRPGQKVFLRLNDFPFHEYGAVEAVIDHISPIYTEEGYLVKIGFPNKLTTTNGENIPHLNHMIGSCEIITNDVRLVDRFFFKFKSKS